MFPERLKYLRRAKRMTQLELAAALGISGATVAMWETGKRNPSFEMLEKLTQVFDKRLDYILGTSDDPTPAALNDAGDAPLESRAMLEKCEDAMRKYALLDDFGQKTIAAILHMEFARCQEQGTLKSAYVSIKERNLPNELLTANITEGK